MTEMLDILFRKAWGTLNGWIYYSPPPIPPVMVESAVTPFTVAREGR